MIRSSASLRDGARLEADLCVIGAGPAGLTVARELASSTLRVCLLESGGTEVVDHPERDPLYEFRYTQLRLSRDSRVRAFGGTSKTWSGRWKRFDAIDFVARDWVNQSGWPIELASLDTYYERAARLAQIREAPASGAESTLLKSEIVIPTAFQTQGERVRDWGLAFERTLNAANNIETYLEAHVIGLERQGRRVDRVHCRGANGPFTVTARAVVIATGGIENARLLLIAGLGNEHDQVGRYYMDHPKAKIGVIETCDPIDVSSWSGLSEDAPSYVGFRLADAVQQRERVLNCQVFLAPIFETDLVRRVARRVVRPRSCRLLAVRNYMEQEPAPDNRVFLVDELDPVGLPRAVVHWTLGERDRESLRTFHRLLLREVQAAGLGELHSPLLHDRPFPEMQDASHHMGTTRMGTDPRVSVVDTSCRLHAMENVYLAGSSVFPTSGYANPTATIVALALRLADHLRARA
jgi:choline dehydrogenase-like flavoprotein